MKEILFRGKRVDNGEWVYGSLIQNKPRLLYSIITRNEYLYDVIPETIGQYTGLTANGVKIFGGDILSERPPMNCTAYIGYVAYDDELAVWRFMIKNDTKFNGVLLGSYSRSYTVIGNIHDNPELLGGVNNVTQNS